jgi:hypothetical protein
MVFLMAITLWSLAGQTLQFTRSALAAKPGVALLPQVANAVVAVLLFVLTAFLVVEAVLAVRRKRGEVQPPAAAVRAA